MTVKFAGKLIPGTHSAVAEMPPEQHVVRTYFWALHGMSEVRSGRGGRNLVLDMWYHYRFPTKIAIDRALELLDQMIGEHGDLQITLPIVVGGTRRSPQAYKRTYSLVTLDAVNRVPIAGQTLAVPLLDISRTVDGGWFQPLQLVFYQLDVAPQTKTTAAGRAGGP